MWCPYFSWSPIYVVSNINGTRVTLIYISRPDPLSSLSSCVSQPTGCFLIINGNQFCLPISPFFPNNFLKNFGNSQISEAINFLSLFPILCSLYEIACSNVLYSISTSNFSSLFLPLNSIQTGRDSWKLH